MQKLLAVLFGLACLATAMISSQILGAGLWSTVMLVTGAFVALSQFIVVLQGLGVALAGLAGLLATGAIMLSLLAANIGGSFNMDDKTGMLLMGFFFMAVLGFTLSITQRWRRKTPG